MSEECDEASLPRVLVDPPWRREVTDDPAPEPIVVRGLKPPAGQAVVWAPGERETWASVRSFGAWKDGEWERAVADYVSGAMTYEPAQAGLFARAPEWLVRPLLTGWRPDVTWDFAHSLKPIVARFELDARAAAYHVARRNAYGSGEVLLPFVDAEVARLMADWLYRLKSARPLAREWFGRHGAAAVPLLVPDALGRQRAVRRNAWTALRLLASHHDVVEAARVHGDAVAEAVARVLATVPPEDVTARRAPPPRVRWADPAALPCPRLREGGGALPVSATAHLVTLLALPGRPGLKDVRDACAPESLAELGWALFEAWRDAGQPQRHTWALTQLGALGDDETVRRLAPIIDAWPGQGGHTKAVMGLGVLGDIGSDLALIHLHGIARKTRSKGLRAAAERTLQQVARSRGLTAEQLADRLVPDFGLPHEGRLVLDYGPRRFTVGFDEQLKPYAVDDDGRRRKDLPKPGAKDDPKLAPAAKRRFAALRKDVRAVAGDQIRRLESAMVERRRWTPAEFTGFFVAHPLMRHIARRLIWTAGTTAFRVAEDGTFADVHDEPFGLPASGRVGIAHPLLLGDDLPAWAESLAEYAVTQPFPQVDRPVYALTEEERDGMRLKRFEGATVPVGALLGLTRHGWERGAPQDNGTEHWIARPVPGGHVVIDLDPGIQTGYVELNAEQRLIRISLGRFPSCRFGDLHPITASEILADLTDLTGKP